VNRALHPRSPVRPRSRLAWFAARRAARWTARRGSAWPPERAWTVVQHGLRQCFLGGEVVGIEVRRDIPNGSGDGSRYPGCAADGRMPRRRWRRSSPSSASGPRRSLLSCTAG
jgi:hypothetical protein